MTSGEGRSTPQGKHDLGSNEHYGSSEQVFELWVDNKKIAEGPREECEAEKNRFAMDFRIPYEKFTLTESGKAERYSWYELDGRKFIDLAGVE